MIRRRCRTFCLIDAMGLFRRLTHNKLFKPLRQGTRGSEKSKLMTRGANRREWTLFVCIESYGMPVCGESVCIEKTLSSSACTFAPPTGDWRMQKEESSGRDSHTKTDQNRKGRDNRNPLHTIVSTQLGSHKGLGQISFLEQRRRIKLRCREPLTSSTSWRGEKVHAEARYTYTYKHTKADTANQRKYSSFLILILWLTNYIRFWCFVWRRSPSRGEEEEEEEEETEVLQEAWLAQKDTRQKAHWHKSKTTTTTTKRPTIKRPTKSNYLLHKSGKFRLPRWLCSCDNNDIIAATLLTVSLQLRRYYYNCFFLCCYISQACVTLVGINKVLLPHHVLPVERKLNVVNTHSLVSSHFFKIQNTEKTLARKVYIASFLFWMIPSTSKTDWKSSFCNANK